MKTSILSLLLLFSFCSLRAGQPESMQSKIETALNDCFRQQSTTPLTAVCEQLKKQNNRMIPYWQAYTLFYESIYYLKTGQKELCGTSLQKAEDVLNKQKDKTSEDYALLAYLQSFSLQFKSGMEAGQTLASVRNNAEKALQADSTNIRAWYVLGSTDYYTPAAFGGGQEAENYLKKAAGLPAQALPNPWLPDWGKDEACGMLIQLYLEKGEKEKARTYYEALKKRSPDSYLIGQYAEKFR